MFATLALQGPHLMVRCVNCVCVCVGSVSCLTGCAQLLDEPTNHLDLFAIKALAEGLEQYGGGLVIISHNQKILSQCCNQTWVVHDATVTKYEGSFEDYKGSIVAHLMAADDTDDVNEIRK